VADAAPLLGGSSAPPGTTLLRGGATPPPCVTVLLGGAALPGAAPPCATVLLVELRCRARPAVCDRTVGRNSAAGCGPAMRDRAVGRNSAAGCGPACATALGMAARRLRTESTNAGSNLMPAPAAPVACSASRCWARFLRSVRLKGGTSADAQYDITRVSSPVALKCPAG